MLTERFDKLRKSELEKIFPVSKIIEIWRKIVKNQLRSLDMKDMYDHYDFNYNIEERAKAIRHDILNGTYKVSQSLTYRIEKKLGVCRHLIAPQPTDALVFQVLVERIATEILKKQPSENTFYSRDRHNVSKPHSFDHYGLGTAEQWKKLQKKIYKFNEEKELVLVTDLSNYYDSIDTKELRKVFTSLAEMNEVIIDLIFRIIEDISWKPDYLPYSGRGLPTTNIEGIRMLAHSFLFEIDDVIKQKTNNCFTRWMDDIVIGVDSRKQAIEIISTISDMLKSRGLALNLSKTHIYNDKEGLFHFQIDENRYIDSIQNFSIEDKEFKETLKQMNIRFKKHLKNTKAKYWEKITKRYITTYGKFNSEKLLNNLSKIYIEYPGIRQNLIYYLLTIGYKKNTSIKVLDILKNLNVFDDISLYQLCYLVTEWKIPKNEDSKIFLENFEEIIMGFFGKRKLSSDFYSILWFKAKYNHPEDLIKFITKYQNKWEMDSFLRRQITAVLPRLLLFDRSKVNELLNSQISSGISSTVTLASQIGLFKDLEKIDTKLSSYLFPDKMTKPYGLSRFLVLCSVLNSDKIRNDDTVKNKIKNFIKDPYYLHWIETQYNIN